MWNRNPEAIFVSNLTVLDRGDIAKMEDALDGPDLNP
jgi:hypothetical protein